MIRNGRKWRRLKARKQAKKAKDRNLQARTLESGDKKSNEIAVKGVAYKVPKDVNITSIGFEDNLTDDELLSVIDGIQDRDRHVQEEDPSDKYISLDLNLTHTQSDIRVSKDDLYPDGWSWAYFPAGKNGVRGRKNGGKPNQSMILKWVKNVKLAGKSTRELEMEYVRIYGVENSPTMDEDKKERLAKSIAYLVARKIWYVGRKPSSVTDEKWDEMTKDKRPAEGSFSANESWVNGFPYGREYSYSSGEDDYH